jgi:endonuclease YncB( thermonuclease family)
VEKIAGNAQVKNCGIATMNRTLKVISILLSYLLISSPSIAGELRVVRVSDGDTIKAVADHMEVVVRLVGIDAPERSRKKNEPGQPYSRQATKYLVSLVLNKTITIKEYGTDRYKRILGVVFVNGTNANLEMVKAGLAEVYRGRQPRYFNVKIYQDAEAAAKDAGRGMWVLGDKYISPREWRKMH